MSSRAEAHEIALVLDGEVLGTFRYSPDKPLSCGARLWFESDKLQLVPKLWETEKKE